MSLKDDEVADVIETLQTHFLKQLSAWECDFVESVEEQWEARHYLTEKQREKLDEIFERCARGYKGSSEGR